MLRYHNAKFRSCRQAKYWLQCSLSIGYSAARQLFVYTKNSTSYQEMLCKPQHDQARVGARYEARVGAKLGHAFNCTRSVIC